MSQRPFTRKVGDQYNFYYTVRVLSPVKSDTKDADGEEAEGRPTVNLPQDPSKGEKTAKFTEGDVDIRPYVASLAIGGENSVNYQLQMALDIPYDDALKFLDSRVLKFGSYLEIQFGWILGNGERIDSDRHFFTISEPAATINDTNITITVQGTDIGYGCLKYKSKRKTYDLETYDQDIKIIEDLIKPYGIEIDQQSRSNLPQGKGLLAKKTAGTPNPEAQPDFIGPPREPNPPASVPYEQNGDDFEFLRKVLSENLTYFYFLGNKLYLSDARFNIATQEPAFTLVWRRDPQDETEVPVQSININVERWMFEDVPPDGARGQTTVVPRKKPARDAQGNKNPKRVERKNIDGGKSRPPAGGNSATPQFLMGLLAPGGKTNITDAAWLPATLRLGPQEQVRPRPPLKDDETGSYLAVPDRDPNATSKTVQYMTFMRRYGNTEAVVVTSGLPTVRTQQVVRLTGIGGRFDGKYIVFRLDHELGPGGFDTKLLLRRDVVTGSERQPFGSKTKGPKGRPQKPGRRGATKEPRTDEGV